MSQAQKVDTRSADEVNLLPRNRMPLMQDSGVLAKIGKMRCWFRIALASLGFMAAPTAGCRHTSPEQRGKTTCEMLSELLALNTTVRQWQISMWGEERARTISSSHVDLRESIAAEIRELINQLKTYLRTCSNNELQVKGRATVGTLYEYLEMYPSATAYYESAIEISTRVAPAARAQNMQRTMRQGIMRIQARSPSCEGQYAQDTDRLESITGSCESTLVLMLTHFRLGKILEEQDNLEEALRHYQEALRLSEEADAEIGPFERENVIGVRRLESRIIDEFDGWLRPRDVDMRNQVIKEATEGMERCERTIDILIVRKAVQDDLDLDYGKAATTIYFALTGEFLDPDDPEAVRKSNLIINAALEYHKRTRQEQLAVARQLIQVGGLTEQSPNKVRESLLILCKVDKDTDFIEMLLDDEDAAAVYIEGIMRGEEANPGDTFLKAIEASPKLKAQYQLYMQEWNSENTLLTPTEE